MDTDSGILRMDTRSSRLRMDIKGRDLGLDTNGGISRVGKLMCKEASSWRDFHKSLKKVFSHAPYPRTPYDHFSRCRRGGLQFGPLRPDLSYPEYGAADGWHRVRPWVGEQIRFYYNAFGQHRSAGRRRWVRAWIWELSPTLCCAERSGGSLHATFAPCFSPPARNEPGARVEQRMQCSLPLFAVFLGRRSFVSARKDIQRK